jgi:hypothetical protein
MTSQATAILDSAAAAAQYLLSVNSHCKHRSVCSLQCMLRYPTLQGYGDTDDIGGSGVRNC